jgi:hypothetical protein
MRSASALALAAALLAPAVARAQEKPAWNEVAWPFLRDAWPNGRAFDCVGGGCGAGMSLFARTKNGFCDCARGVSDDDEIDRVGDVYLVSPDFKPLAASLPRELAGMNGRVRLYETLDAKPMSVLSLAGGRDCNAFVAMAVSAAAFPEKGADAAADFINVKAFSDWVAAKQAGG